MVKCAILGGGLTGITLARLLREREVEVVVLEAGREIGGLCRSRTESGFTFDIGGSHIIFSRDREVLDLMLGWLGDNRTSRQRNTKIFYRGLLIKYPFENGLAGLPKEDLFFCVNEFVKTLIAVEKGELPEPSDFREWIVHTFGRGIAECYMIPYNEKIWNYPTGKMSCHWVEGRVPRPPVEDVIRSAVGIETEGYTHQAQFSYPLRGGIEALVKAIAVPVADAIITGFTVRSIRRTGNGFEISDGSRTIQAGRCICTMPVQALLAALDEVPDDVFRAARALRFNSLVTVCLGVKGEVPPLSWLYLPHPENGLANRVSFPSNYSEGVAPPGHGAVLAEITYNRGDSVSAMDDEELLKSVTGSLSAMGLIDGDNIVYRHVSRQEYAYVVYDLAYLSNISIVREFCRGWGIPLVGRFAQFEYLNMDGCIRSAIDFVGGWT